MVESEVVCVELNGHDYYDDDFITKHSFRTVQYLGMLNRPWWSQPVTSVRIVIEGQVWTQ